MLYQKHVEHFRRAGDDPDEVGRFLPASTVRIEEGSAFSLTEAGAEFADEFLAAVLLPRDPKRYQAAWSRVYFGPFLPRYDPQERLFAWGRHVLKRFRQPADNQQL